MARRRTGGYSLSVLIVFMLAAAIVSGAAVYTWQNPGLFGSGSINPPQDTKTLRETVQQRADEVLHAMKAGDMKKLAEYVHPDKGLKFSPYSNVTDKAVSINASQLPSASADPSKRLWGIYDGSGENIELSFNDYFKKFVYAQDYLQAPEIIFNQAVKRGNSINNIKDAFKDGVCIEYYFSGFEKQYEGMDWRSLTLVFEQKSGTWYLAGLVNNQWTI